MGASPTWTNSGLCSEKLRGTRSGTLIQQCNACIGRVPGGNSRGSIYDVDYEIVHDQPEVRSAGFGPQKGTNASELDDIPFTGAGFDCGLDV